MIILRIYLFLLYGLADYILCLRPIAWLVSCLQCVCLTKQNKIYKSDNEMFHITGLFCLIKAVNAWCIAFMLCQLLGRNLGR